MFIKSNSNISLCSFFCNYQNYFYSSLVEYGRPEYLVDKDLGSQVHLKYTEGEPCWFVFNLRKAYQIAALRLRPAWSNGPKKVRLSFSAFLTGPWAVAAESEVDGREGGSYIMERWQGKVTQGYRVRYFISVV